jgi:hypothetical protein
MQNNTIQMQYYQGSILGEANIEEFSRTAISPFSFIQLQSYKEFEEALPEIGGDLPDNFVDFVKLALIFTSSYVLAEFIKAFSSKAGEILAEKLFESMVKTLKAKSTKNPKGSDNRKDNQTNPELDEDNIFVSVTVYMQGQKKAHLGGLSLITQLEDGKILRIDTPKKLQTALVDEFNEALEKTTSQQFEEKDHNE